MAHISRHGWYLVVTEWDYDEVLGFDHVLRHSGETVVAEVKGHQLLYLEEVWRETRVPQGIVARVHNLGMESRYMEFVWRSK